MLKYWKSLIPNERVENNIIKIAALGQKRGDVLRPQKQALDTRFCAYKNLVFERPIKGNETKI